MNKMAKKKRSEGADIASGMALMVTGIANRADTTPSAGAPADWQGAAALKKKAAGGDQKPLPKGFVPITLGKTPVLNTAPKQRLRKDEKALSMPI
jgi:hypothetical protein